MINILQEASTAIVIDASLAIWAIMPIDTEINVLDLFVKWRKSGVKPVAPMLWLAECTSAIRRLVHNKEITSEEGQNALDDLFNLTVDIIPMTDEHCRSALLWSERLDQAKAYDSFYLALSEDLNTELWTADRRLANAVHEKNISWVHWVGE